MSNSLTISTETGYLKVTDETADVWDDSFTDHNGDHQYLTVATLSEASFAEVRTAADVSLLTFRDALHKRPGISVGGREHPLDWHQWDQLTSLTWKEWVQLRAQDRKE